MSTPDSTAGLMASLRQVVDDAEELLRASSGTVSDEVVGLRTRMTDSLTAARRRLQQAEGKLTDRARIAALLADRYVHRNPWKVIGIASTVALVVGAVLPALTRRGEDRKSAE